MKYPWITILILLVAFTDGLNIAGNSSQSGSTTTATTVDTTTKNISFSGSPSETTMSITSPTPITTTTSYVSSTISTVAGTTEIINSNSSVNTTTTENNSTAEFTSSTGDSTTKVPSISTSMTTMSKPEVTSISTTDSSPAATTTVDFLQAGVKISETNILLTDSDNESLFVEIRTTSDVDSVWLVILDANKTTKEQQLLLKHECNINKSNNGYHTYIMDNETQPSWNRLRNLESVLIALYANNNSANGLNMSGLYDILLYSSFGNIDTGLIEEFSNQDLIIIDHKKLKSLQGISLSRCSEEEKANTATVLTYESPNEINRCILTINESLEMKLTIAADDCSSDLVPNFNDTLAKNLITDVNAKEHCGFAFYMLRDMKINALCPPKPKVKEIQVGFTVKSAFPDQLDLIMNGFVSQSKLYLDGETYDICFQNCFPKEPVPIKSADNRVRVTVTVVISCITVFLLVVLFLFLYMRRKKKGILQFSMARLDEDDAFIGDMDDFVGNQGPTFRNFK